MVDTPPNPPVAGGSPPPSPPPPPAPPRRRAPRAPGEPAPRKRSHAGRIAGAALGVASVLGVGGGLFKAGQPPAPGTPAAACGGTERWPVKVANDADAPSVNPNATPANIADLNQNVLPDVIDPGGRMALEKQEHTITGYLAFFKHEDDGDYHAVITDGGAYNSGRGDASGHSIVVEFPDPNCFSGKGGKGANTSQFSQAIADARSQFESATANLDGTHIPLNSVKITVSGVQFFDFDHGQTGHAVHHLGKDGQWKVLELHPVTYVSIGDAEPD